MKKTIVVTGGTSGIGLALSKQLLKAGHHVICVGSRPESVQRAKSELTELYPHTSMLVVAADLSRQREVNFLAESIKGYLKEQSIDKIDVLINNAGAVRDKFTLTEDNVEYQFATNHLAGLLLAYRLLPMLMGGMILFTGSYSHYRAKIKWKDIMHRKCYYILAAYRQTKLANVMSAKMLNELLTPLHIRSYVVDPGLVNTDIAMKHVSWLIRLVWHFHRRQGTTTAVPVKTFMYLIEQRPQAGLYFRDSIPIRYNRLVDRIEEVSKLLELSEDLLKVDFRQQVENLMNEN